MKRFVSIVALFLLPFAVFYGLMAFILSNSRETAPLDDVVDATVSGELVLYGSAYHENFQAYKYRVTSQLAPRLLVLGTSRSMQLRGEFFSESSFYNAGGAIRNAADYLLFLQALPEESLPDTVLIALDQNMFNPTWADGNRAGELQLGDLPVKTDLLLRMGNSFGDGKFSILDCLTLKQGVYGLAALGRGSGFVADGSYRYGTAAEANLDEPEKNFSDTYRNIDFSTLRFAWGDEVSSWALEQMDQLLAWCTERGIRVVAFLAPLPPVVYQRMVDNGNFGYIEKLPGELGELFSSYGQACYDKTLLPNTSSVQYLDGFHGGDEIYAQIVLELAAEDPVMEKLVDTEATQALLQTPHDNPRVLPG